MKRLLFLTILFSLTLPAQAQEQATPKEEAAGLVYQGDAEPSQEYLKFLKFNYQDNTKTKGLDIVSSATGMARDIISLSGDMIMISKAIREQKNGNVTVDAETYDVYPKEYEWIAVSFGSSIPKSSKYTFEKNGVKVDFVIEFSYGGQVTVNGKQVGKFLSGVRIRPINAIASGSSLAITTKGLTPININKADPSNPIAAMTMEITFTVNEGNYYSAVFHITANGDIAIGDGNDITVREYKKENGTEAFVNKLRRLKPLQVMPLSPGIAVLKYYLE